MTLPTRPSAPIATDSGPKRLWIVLGLLLLTVALISGPLGAAQPAELAEVTTIAGTGPPKPPNGSEYLLPDASGQDGAYPNALNVPLYAPKGIALDRFGNLFFNDTFAVDYVDAPPNSSREAQNAEHDSVDNGRKPRIRKIVNERISTVAGGLRDSENSTWRTGMVLPQLYGLKYHKDPSPNPGAQGAIYISTSRAVFKISEGKSGTPVDEIRRDPQPPGSVSQERYNADTEETVRHVAGRCSENIDARAAVPATDGCLYQAHDIAFDQLGNMFVASAVHNTVKKVTHGGNRVIDGCHPPVGGCSTTNQEAQKELMTTVVGIPSVGEYTGDGLPGKSSTLQRPSGLAFDRQGNLYIADTYHHLIRKVTPGVDKEITGADDEITTTVAGTATVPNPQRGYRDGKAAAIDALTGGLLDTPRDVEIDEAGNLLVADAENDRIRMITPGPDGEFDGEDDSIKTVAGTNLDQQKKPVGRDNNDAANATDQKYCRDIQCPALEVKLEHPFSLAIAPCLKGSLTTDVYFTEWMNRKVRKLSGVAQCTNIDLSIETIVDTPDPVTVGSDLTYSITAVNKGRDEARGVKLTSTLPAGVPFKSAASPEGDCALGPAGISVHDGAPAGGEAQVVCSLLSMGPGESSTVKITVTPGRQGQISLHSEVRFMDLDPSDCKNPEEEVCRTNDEAPADNSATEATTVELPAVPPLPAPPCLVDCGADGGGGSTDGSPPPGSTPPATNAADPNQTSITVTTPPGGPGAPAPSTVPVSSPASGPSGQQVPLTGSLGFQAGPANAPAPASSSSQVDLAGAAGAAGAAAVAGVPDEQGQPAARYSMVAHRESYAGAGLLGTALLAALGCVFFISTSTPVRPAAGWASSHGSSRRPTSRPAL